MSVVTDRLTRLPAFTGSRREAKNWLAKQFHPEFYIIEPSLYHAVRRRVQRVTRTQSFL